MLPSRDPIVKDEGIVLRWFPVTDTSRIVLWFTKNHGRISTIIRGSQRAKSWSLGQFDLFYTCELLFYIRAKDDLQILRECYPLAPRSHFRSNWTSCAGASFISDILYRMTPRLVPDIGLYRLATGLLDLFDTQSPTPLHVFWFELQVLKIIGLEPNLDFSKKVPILFDPQSGSVIERKEDTFHRSEARPATEGAIAIMRMLLQTEDPARLNRIRPFPDQVIEVEHHLDAFTRWHLDLEMESRRHALSWISHPLNGVA